MSTLLPKALIPKALSGLVWPQRLLMLAVTVGQLLAGNPAAAQTVTLAQVPLLALKTAPGLVMLNMSRDHRLFYAAYNDTSDIDGDGVIDIGYKPSVTYFGNFVSNRCYDYINSGTIFFRPVTTAVVDDNLAGSSTGCRVGATQRWHGNWLNYATTSRMDALRRTLYGGYRVVDSASTIGGSTTSTILQGAYIPQDSHVWGKEFRPGRDTYDIRKYTTLAVPATGTQHLFAVVSPAVNSSAASYGFLQTSVAPVLRYITDANLTTERIWFWTSADVAQGIASSSANFVKGGGRISVASTDRVLRVEACVPFGAQRESGCVGYPTNSPAVWKPTGVLHDYGATDSLKFGLLTGSYTNNYSGGVVRRNIQSFTSEYSAVNGTFNSSNDGIARTIDRIAVQGWNGSTYDCSPDGTYNTSGDRLQGTCKSWGAPIAEMMYEGLRFFSGKGTPTSVYAAGVAAGADNAMGFSALPVWQNPFQSKLQSATYGNPICSRPVQMVIADPITSYDSDQLPGAYFGPTTGFGTPLVSNDLIGLNVTSEANAIWTAESLGTRNVFIGQSGTTKDGNPTPKTASSFSQLRGHAPDATRFEGSYHAGSVARFARGQKNNTTGVVTNGIPIGNPIGIPAVPTVNNTQVDTLAVALGSLTPKIEIPNLSGGFVTIVPISKAVGNAGINKAPGSYQATGAITGFYFANYTPTSIQAVVNFSDSDQGTDNETDAQAVYDISIAGTAITVKMSQLDKYPGGIESHMGYVISGTTADGMYLDMRTSTAGSGNVVPQANVYYLDTLPSRPGQAAVPPSGGLAGLPAQAAQTGQAPAPALPTVRSNGSVAVAAVLFPNCPVGTCPAIAADICPAYDPTLSSPTTPYGIDAQQPSGGTAAAIAQRNYKLAVIAKLDTCLPSWGDKYTGNAQTSRAFTMAAVPTTTGYIPKDPLWYAAKYGGAGVLDSKGDPINYFRVTNPSQLPTQVGKAFRSAAALAAVASTSVVGVGQRSVGSAALYQATFESLTWTSRLYAFSIDSAGNVSNTPLWDAANVLPAPASRNNMYLGRGGTNAPFKLNSGGYSSLGTTGTPSEQTDFGDANIYQFLMGDKTGEERNGGGYRNRGASAASETGSVLGDIVNSDPQIIAKSDYGYATLDTSYTSYVSSLNTETLAVGSNDGFFHLFNAAASSVGGNEIFAFMPQAARNNIKDLASPAYQHRYFVDGSIGQGHAKIAVPGDVTVGWRTVVVGTGGSGAQTVFAINAPSNQTYTGNNVLWEINGNSTLPVPGSLGNVEGKPAIGKLANGTWVALFGNGYNSTAGTASLFVVNLATGAILAQLSTNNAITNNGMGSTVIVRTVGSDTIQFVYGADYKGNIWRFDLTGGTPAVWGSSTSKALVYRTPTGRPITAEITVGPATGKASILSGKMIYFGTGSFLNSADVTTTTPAQALYGIYDDLATTNNLSGSPAVDETSLSVMGIIMGSTTSDTRKTTAVTAGAEWYNLTGKKGWVVPFSGTNVAAGERVIAPPTRFTITGTIDAMLFTSIVPSVDECVAGVDAWITSVDAMTGGAAKAFSGLDDNAIKVTGGSPRGVFVLQDGGTPMLFISQTIFNGIVPTTSYTTSTGGVQKVTTGGTTGQTQTAGVTLVGKPAAGCIGLCKTNSVRKSNYWRQLK